MFTAIRLMASKMIATISGIPPPWISFSKITDLFTHDCSWHYPENNPKWYYAGIVWELSQDIFPHVANLHIIMCRWWRFSRWGNWRRLSEWQSQLWWWRRRAPMLASRCCAIWSIFPWGINQKWMNKACAVEYCVIYAGYYKIIALFCSSVTPVDVLLQMIISSAGPQLTTSVSNPVCALGCRQCWSICASIVTAH